MTEMLLEPSVTENAQKDFANELRQDVIAIRLAFRQFGSSRTFSTAEKGRVAREFDADVAAVSASTRLYPVRGEELKAISKALSRTREDFNFRTMPYVEKGVRLLKKCSLDLFVQSFEEHQEQLSDALLLADLHYDEIIQAQRQKIGYELFHAGDYPTQFAGSVAAEWSVLNFEPNEELLKLAPETYRREQQRVRQQFEESISIFEDQCKSEMSKMIESLLDKLKPTEEGKRRKQFNETTTDNLRQFFDRFQNLGVFSDQGMTDLVGQAKAALGDTTMADVKQSALKKAQLSEAFKEISSTLGTMLVDSAERKIDLSDLEDV